LDNSRLTQKSKEYKKDEDFEESSAIEKADIKEKCDDIFNDAKKEINFENVSGSETTNNFTKRNFSDIDDDEGDEIDDNKKKKKKDLEMSKDTKQNIVRTPTRVEKNLKQATNSKNSTSTSSNKSVFLCDKDEGKNKFHDTELEDDDSKSDPLCNGGLKVPPLKIVIPQQSCTIDTDGSGLRTGKINTSRNAALPYVVSSNSDSNERDISISNTSPRDSPIKVNLSCGDDKNCKLLNEEKNLRVLRSAHRIGITTHDRASNNSSPQIPSNSPSPASSTNIDLVEGKIAFSNSINSPTHQSTSFESDNIQNLPSPSTSSTSSSKETMGNIAELHPRKRKIRTKNDDVKSSNTGNNVNNDPILCTDSHPHDIPFTNCFQMYMAIRKQIERKWKNIFSVKPRPPQGFHEYLINKQKYLLCQRQNKNFPEIPNSLSFQMRDIFLIQQKERFDLYQRHTVEKEKLCLNVEQEIIRIHSKAARSMSYQSLPFSVCTYIKDEEVYNMLTPELDDKEKNARCRFNGRLLLSWLQDVDDKWEKIKPC
ncbi:ankyrin repeat domain-containing protein 11, partial [Lucilia cuprina]|uniref:ankyrin repeat domain-containing protein 11 n=1 Tax=Lucilia cuprina TaxID=7375 RepID=UPI001F05BE67